MGFVGCCDFACGGWFGLVIVFVWVSTCLVSAWFLFAIVAALVCGCIWLVWFVIAMLSSCWFAVLCSVCVAFVEC